MTDELHSLLKLRDRLSGGLGRFFLATKQGVEGRVSAVDELFGIPLLECSDHGNELRGTHIRRWIFVTPFLQGAHSPKANVRTSYLAPGADP